MRGGRNREESRVYTALRWAPSAVGHALETLGVNVKGNSSYVKQLLINELWNKNRNQNKKNKTYNLPIQLCWKQQRFQACFRVLFAFFFSPSFWQLCCHACIVFISDSGCVAFSFSLPRSFIVLTVTIPIKKKRKGVGDRKNHTAAGFPSVSLKSLSYKFTASSIITSLGHL